MTPTTSAILICRGVGLYFLVAGLAATLPDLLFNPFYDWTRFRPSESGRADLSLLWRSHAGHEMLSNLLGLLFGILLLIFSRRFGQWLASGLPTTVA